MFTNIILVTVPISFSFSSFSLENIAFAFYFSFKSKTYQHNMHLKYCNCIFSIFVAFWHKIVFPIGFSFFFLWICLFSSFNLHLDLCIIRWGKKFYVFGGNEAVVFWFLQIQEPIQGAKNSIFGIDFLFFSFFLPLWFQCYAVSIGFN